MCDTGMGCCPPWKRCVLAIYPLSALLWKNSALPTKSCRATSALVGKACVTAGQAGASLHTLAVLQGYQADLLKEMDYGKGLAPEAVK